MRTNVSKKERSARAIVGIIFLLLASNVFAGGIKFFFLILGLILLLTGAIGYCPFYRFLGKK